MISRKPTVNWSWLTASSETRNDSLAAAAHQHVFVPSRQTLWLKAREYSDWTEISLQNRCQNSPGKAWLH